MSTSYINYKEYLKNKKLNRIRCDEELGNISSIKNYPNYKQYNKFLNCIDIPIEVIEPKLDPWIVLYQEFAKMSGLDSGKFTFVFEPSGNISWRRMDISQNHAFGLSGEQLINLYEASTEIIDFSNACLSSKYNTVNPPDYITNVSFDISICTIEAITAYNEIVDASPGSHIYLAQTYAYQVLTLEYTDYTSHKIDLSLNYINHGTIGLDHHCQAIFDYIEDYIDGTSWASLETDLSNNKQNKTLGTYKTIFENTITIYEAIETGNVNYCDVPDFIELEDELDLGVPPWMGPPDFP